MSDNKKITIEKREFKLKDGENFILEYPSNFEEIANKKLSKIQQEYDESISSKNANQKNNNDDNKKYYQQIGDIKKENIEEKKEVKLEPQEGFIEINNNKFKNKNELKSESDEEINSDEFYEVEEKENKDNKNINENLINNNKEKESKNEEKQRNISPVKDAEDIKLTMKKLNFKVPKWAENLTDDDFIKMAKNKKKK